MSATTTDDVLATIERWTITRYQGDSLLADVFRAIHDSRSSGRLMLHVSQGRVQAIEWCERATANGDKDTADALRF